MAEPQEPAQARLAQSMVGWYEQLRQILHPQELARSAAARKDELEAIESDLADFARPFFAHIAEHPDTEPKFADALRTMVQPVHQQQLVIVFAGIYALIRQLVDAAIAPYAQGVQNNAFSLDPSTPLSPAELALGIVRDTLGGLDPYTEALKAGLTNDRLDILERNTGDALGIQEALLLYRRNQMDDATLEKDVRQSRIRTEWLPYIKALRYAPPPAGEVVAGRLKNHLSEADYLRMLSEAGIDPANADWMLHTAGRPYGIHEALDLWNRGEITEARVEQVIAQSDVNPDYTDDIKKLRRYLPPPRSVVPLLRSGAITEDYARQLLEMHGLTPTDADAFVAEATMTKTSAAKELSASQVLKLYENRLISRDEATVRLAALRYPQDEIDLLLTATDDARHIAYVNAVIARVHARYVASKLTRAEAISTLLRDGLPNDAITDYLTLWDLERDANYHALTPSQVVGAYRRDEIGAAEVKARLLEMGVQPRDLKIVLVDGWPPTKPPSPQIVDAVLNA